MSENPSDSQEMALTSEKEVDELHSTDSSLSLSLTPPLLDNDDDNQNTAVDNNSDSISEHISTATNSVENDRSYQEIEISSQPLLDLVLKEESNSDNTLTSFNNCEYARDILNEIVNNIQPKSLLDSVSSKEESLDIFANLDLDDKSLSNFKQTGDVSLNVNDVFSKIKDFEEIISVKDNAIAALTTELDSYRENSNTNTISMVSTTEYKQLQEECHSKLAEYNSAILFKDDLIKQLSESLDQSVGERKLLLSQIDVFKEEIAQLQAQIVVEKTDGGGGGAQTFCSVESSPKKIAQNVSPPEINYTQLENVLDTAQLDLLNNLKRQINEYVDQKLTTNKSNQKEEIDTLKEKIEVDKEDYEIEIRRLRDLLANIKCGSTEIMELKNELEAKHSKEVEELRLYFEKKCSELEKNYSEEIFSQHSRKMSGSSSENDLNSDILFASNPGPGGDFVPELVKVTRKDFGKLKEELKKLSEIVNNYDANELNDENLKQLSEEINKSSLQQLLKCDLTSIKNDLQNKYHAELEILTVEHENKIDVLNLEFENKYKSLENKYEEKILSLKSQFQPLVRPTVQEAVSPGEFEINEVVESYERRLQEQVTLAKIDIISALENQIQRLVANEAEDEEWPSELLQLRDRFTDKYEREISKLKDDHAEEIAKLKEEHLKVLNGALERASRRSLRDSDSLSKGEAELLKERDSLKKQASSLRNLLGELLKYFTQCEDELNNTLVDELVKQGFEKTDDDFNLNDSSTTNSSRTDSSCVKRVHLTPNFSDLINLIESRAEVEDDSVDISIDLKNELGLCLDKLKQDANAILALTSSLPKTSLVNSPRHSLEEKVTSLTRQVISETQKKDQLQEELEEAMSIIQSLEKEKESLETKLDQVIAKENVLEDDLGKARDKIAELIENGHKEIVSEGYGDIGQNAEGDTMQSLSDLQEKARNMLMKSRTSADPVMLNLIEDLCQVCEKIREESKKERQDLLQQIAAADKKYKQTRAFLDEQASEREHERDEAQKKIDNLHDQLRERDRDRTSCERFTSEETSGDGYIKDARNVENLELQLQDMTKTLDEEARRYKEVESERDEAVEKIKVLRDIIRDLESQVESDAAAIQAHISTVDQLKRIVDEQSRVLEDIKQDEAVQNFVEVEELKKHIEFLESDNQRLRILTELAGSEGALKQVKLQIHDLEVTIDKRTIDLEGLYSVSNNSCSSPSEDMSVRDMLRPQTPNSMVLDECEVPLQQLARLKEKLVRHSRAEDAAIKKIKDLEMQVFNAKVELEETQGEKDILKNQVQEHLVLISDLQIRLDEQRIRAEHIEKQTNSSLEMKIYDLQNDVTALNELLHKKDKEINQMKATLEQMSKRLKEQEMELISNVDDEMVVTMQKEIEQLRTANNQMKTKITSESQMLPNLVENIISDKNTDIEKLKDKLDEYEKKLECYTSLNLDLKELQSISAIKRSGNSFSEILSLVDLSHPEQMRDAQIKDVSTPLIFKRKKDETIFLGSEPEISRIEKFGPMMVHSPAVKANSTELYKSLEKKVHFKDEEILMKLNADMFSLKTELDTKNAMIEDYEARLKVLSDLEEKIQKLQFSLEETEKTLTKTQESFEKEQKEILDREQNLRVELAEKKMHLSEKEKRIDLLEKDSQRKDQMMVDLTREKKDLEKEICHLKHEHFVNFDNMIKEKNDDILKLQEQVDQTSNHNERIRSLQEEVKQHQNELKQQRQMVSEMQEKVNGLELKLKEETDQNKKLVKEIANNKSLINSYKEEFDNLSKKISKKKQTIKELGDSLNSLKMENKKQNDQIIDKDCEIEILNEDAKRYQNDLTKLENEILSLNEGQSQIESNKLKSTIQEKERLILDLEKKSDDLSQEVMHLQEVISNKEKVIEKMADDHKIVNSNLILIQKKIKEPFGLLETRQKLKEELKKNADLVQELHLLKAQLVGHDVKNTDMEASVEEITGQLKRELEYSAEIDTNILSALSDQSLSSISDNNDLETYKKAVAKEKSKNFELVKLKSKLEKQVVELQSELHKEKTNIHQIQLEDAALIEQMRIKLDSALDNEEQFAKILEKEKNQRLNLEKELEQLRLKQTTTNSRSDSTEYKNLPSRESKLKAELDKEVENNQNLKLEVKLLNRTKSELESSLKHTNDLWKIEKERVKSLDESIKKFLENETNLREKFLQNMAQLEFKIKEVEQYKTIVDNLTIEKDNLLKQKIDLLKDVKKQNNSVHMESPVHEALMNKIKEINTALIDNKKMVDIIKKLQNDNRTLEIENANLKLQHSPNNQVADTSARCEYLFAKTLRLRSYRKALIWQKRYLLDMLQAHELHCHVHFFVGIKSNEKNKKSSSITKFRGAVSAVIAVIRMKYLVTRWHSGKRAAEKINYRHINADNIHQVENPTTHFQIGQPVSNKFFVTTPTSPFDEIEPKPDRIEQPWSGSSPPQRENRSISRLRIGNNLLSKQDMAPLKAPQLLAQFSERIENMQEKLSVVLDSKNN